MPRGRLLARFACVLALAVTLSGAQDPQQPPVFRGGVDVVRVDVIVTDRTGKPVNDLKATDFEVTEDGKPQKIDTFKLISLDGGLVPGPDGPPPPIRNDATEELEAARDDVRLFAVFLDDYHVKKTSSEWARTQISRFLETQLGPSDMIGLMMPLDPLASVRMTRNHDAIRRGIEQFQGRKYDYRPKTDAEAQYVYRLPPEQIENIRNQVSFAALKSLIMRMGALKEGRKALILVSEGYTGALPRDLTQMDPITGQLGGGRPANQDPRTQDPRDLNEFTRQAFSQDTVNQDLRDVFDLANRNNVAIYPVDPRGLATAEFDIDTTTGRVQIDQRTDQQFLNSTMDTLRTLAENTDGRVVVNRNDLAIAMKQIIVDSSAYYLLGYNTSTKPDGKFHKIDVKIKRPGLQSPRHRQGYWALKPEEAARMTAAPAAPAPVSPVVAELAKTTTPRSRVIRTWMGIARGENGKTRVTLVWEPVPRTPGDRVRESDQPARVNITASSADGPLYFRGRVPETGPVSPTAGARVSFDATPGLMELRLSVEGSSAEVLDSESREVTIPDFSATKNTFETAEVFRARTLPELQRLRTDREAIPSVAREFSRTERLLLRLHPISPAGTSRASAITARLLNRAGQAMADLPLSPGTDPPQIELTLSSLPAGDYAVEVVATVPDGGEPIKDLIAFRVTP